MNLSSDPFVSLAWQQIWQIAVVAIAVAAITRLACRRRPHLASILWMLVIVKALTPPVWSSPGSAFSWALAERPASIVQRHAGLPTPEVDDELVSFSSAEPVPLAPTAASAIELLAGLKNVRELDLSHSEITDAGLVSLAGLTNLRVLKINSSRTTPEGRAALGKAISGLRVTADNLGWGVFRVDEDESSLLE